MHSNGEKGRKNVIIGKILFDSNEVTVERKPRKSVVLSVRGGTAVLRAPLWMDDGKLLSFLESHRRWLTKNLSAEERTFDFSDGAKLCLFGKERTIACGRARLNEHLLFLPEGEREKALTALLKREMRAYMEKITREIAERFGFHYAKVRIGSARSRWGACSSKGNITYSFRAAFLTEELLYYLAAHELCHTRQMNHGTLFWREVERIVPNFRTCRKALKGYRWAMNCL